MEHERGGVSPPARANPPPHPPLRPRGQLVYMRHARRASHASANGARRLSGVPPPSPDLHPVVSVDERRRSSVVHCVLGVDMSFRVACAFLWSVVFLICIPPGADCKLVCAFFGSCAAPRFAFRISSHSVSSLVCLPARPRPPHYPRLDTCRDGGQHPLPDAGQARAARAA